MSLPAEALKALDEHNIEIITSLLQHNIQQRNDTNRNETLCIYNSTQETQSNDLYRV